MEKQNEFIIPTRYKAKLPRFLSYPVGAETVTEFLKDLSIIKEVQLSFSSATLAKKEKHIGKPYTVFEIEYVNIPTSLSMPNNDIRKGYYKDKWQVTVYPVPVEVKHFIKNLMVEFGFNKLKEWFRLNETINKFHGVKRFSILFNENSRVLEYIEYIHG